MRTGKLIFSVIALLFSAFMLMTGMFFLLIEISTPLRELLVTTISEHSPVVRVIGIALIFCALTIIVTIRNMERGLTIRTQMGEGNICTIKPSLIEGYLDVYWKEHFPEEHIVSEVAIGRRGIEIIATFSHRPNNELPSLNTIENDLTSLFAEKLGSVEPFTFTLHVSK